MDNTQIDIFRRLLGKCVETARLHRFRDCDDGTIYSTELELELSSPINSFGSRWVYLRIAPDGQTPEVLTAPPGRAHDEPDALIAWEIGDWAAESTSARICGESVTSVGLIEYVDGSDAVTGLSLEFGSCTTVFVVPNVEAQTNIVASLDDAEFAGAVRVRPLRG